MVATATEKKVRYLNADTRKIAWAFPADLPDYAMEQASVKKQLGLVEPEPEPLAIEDVAGSVEPLAPSHLNDYTDFIEQFRDELRTAAGDLRVARDEMGRINARSRAEQFRLAIDVYTAAQDIPEKVVQFGAYADQWHFRVPPRIPEFDDISPLRRAVNHRYVTSDPVEIAYLRMLKQKGLMSDLVEVPVGHVYSRPPGGRDGIWVSLDTYEQQKKIGQAQ